MLSAIFPQANSSRVAYTAALSGALDNGAHALLLQGIFDCYIVETVCRNQHKSQDMEANETGSKSPETQVGQGKPAQVNARRLSVAPMMDWTDRHCRYFHRQISHHTWLYTEMVTTGALLHGDVPRHLDFDEVEHPVALQLGGSEPDDLAKAARLGEQWGYN